MISVIIHLGIWLYCIFYKAYQLWIVIEEVKYEEFYYIEKVLCEVLEGTPIKIEYDHIVKQDESIEEVELSSNNGNCTELVLPLSSNSESNISEISGDENVYIICSGEKDGRNTINYIGKSKSIKNRLKQHLKKSLKIQVVKFMKLANLY